jgi:hypothetical protein
VRVHRRERRGPGAAIAKVATEERLRAERAGWLLHCIGGKVSYPAVYSVGANEASSAVRSGGPLYFANPFIAVHSARICLKLR